ncbi:hypothetical protein AVEN_77484-1 [Araneus ventricosus]|uniref:Uncharacterized protein n=1 Tax=Araneus ventricosus TaxID=182803 RepID=A0A4Y2NG19_ARAVE|nr:hypothetical protein AVEN_77484-1 [Araneus ventricosus]
MILVVCEEYSEGITKRTSLLLGRGLRKALSNVSEGFQTRICEPGSHEIVSWSRSWEELNNNDIGSLEEYSEGIPREPSLRLRGLVPKYVECV